MFPVRRTKFEVRVQNFCDRRFFVYFILFTSIKKSMHRKSNSQLFLLRIYFFTIFFFFSGDSIHGSVGGLGSVRVFKLGYLKGNVIIITPRILLVLNVGGRTIDTHINGSLYLLWVGVLLSFFFPLSPSFVFKRNKKKIEK